MKSKLKIQLLIMPAAIAIVILSWFTIGQAIPNKEHIKIGPKDYVLGDEGNSPVGTRTVFAKNNIQGLEQSNRQRGKGMLTNAFTSGHKTITLAYTCVTEKLIVDRIVPGFQKYWFEKTGQEVDFVTGYSLPDFDKVATSISDQPVQVLIMSSSSNTESRGFTHTKWHDTPNKGVVYSIAQVFLVRKGNPLRLKTYADLGIPGVRVIHLNPIKGTGGGIWPVYAFYGSALKESEVNHGEKNYQTADEQLQKIQENAFYEGTDFPIIKKLFLKGMGDALAGSENSALNTVKANDNVEVVVPPYTIVNDFSVEVMKKNIGNGDREVVDEFVDFLFSKEVQEYAASEGYRPSDPEVLAMHPEFKELINPFHLGYLGEQTKMKKEILLEKWLTNNNNRSKYPGR